MGVDESMAVVTGGGRGIGAAISKRMAEDGYRVLLTYNSDSQSAEDVVNSIRGSGGDAVAVKVNCGAPAEIRVLAEHPWCEGGVDILILNHGFYGRINASELDSDNLRETMEVNFFGAFGVWESLRQHLRVDARIVVIGSQLGVRGSPHGAHYAASKAALATWARSLAQDVGPEGQRVNIIAPGYIDTAILAGDTPERTKQREAEVPLRRIGQPEDVAGTVSFLCSQDSAYVNGAVIHVNGGLFLP